jgi:hypothetical protein
MARKSSSGSPFPARRKGVGKYVCWYVCWRILDAAIAPFLRGEIHRSWAVASHALGKTSVKLSLQTGDHATACDRWSEVHARVEALIRDATTLAKRDEEAKRKVEKAPTLTSEERATIAGQARHDVLADHDAGWSVPDHMSAMTRGLRAPCRPAESIGCTIQSRLNLSVRLPLIPPPTLYARRRARWTRKPRRRCSRPGRPCRSIARRRRSRSWSPTPRACRM